MKLWLVGVDIGGTKCAVNLACLDGEHIEIIDKRRFLTLPSPAETLARVIMSIVDLLASANLGKGLGTNEKLAGIGVSCGGPLDSQAGLILSPPNLPGWDRVDVIKPLRQHFNVPVGLQNDANACALAEWRWGAGRGCQNMVFLTFGTGMGAGLILDGRLYSGTNDLAGEVGHIRLEKEGPVGYGKAGSFEGFCSGGGIAHLARMMVIERLGAGKPASFCPTPEHLSTITAEVVGMAAQQGDALALEVFEIVGRQLGRGLAILVDLLNPQRIVIGSIYGRQRSLLEPIILRALQEEALPLALSVCQVVPADLGESVGDLASLSVALQALV